MSHNSISHGLWLYNSMFCQAGKVRDLHGEAGYEFIVIAVTILIWSPATVWLTGILFLF